jgi:hypothetical protein
MRFAMSSLVAVVGVVGGLSGCSASSGDAIVLPSSLPGSSVVVTTVPSTVVATTVVSTTVPSVTDVATTQPPTTVARTVPPTTLSVEDQVREATIKTRQVFRDCHVVVETCDFAAYGVPGSPADKLLRDTMADRLANRLRIDPKQGSNREVITSVKATQTSATVEICQEDGRVLVDIRNPDDPDDDVLFNDELGTVRLTATFRKTAEGWRVESMVRNSVRLGVASCGS